jgi:ADP-heptose:LPS heptosyltransferase
MRALDLVISVDSMTAHLAGALGVSVWSLLHAEADWRWMDEREDSPWYPTMRLFQQKQPGNWVPVIARVADELAVLAGAMVQASASP